MFKSWISLASLARVVVSTGVITALATAQISISPTTLSYKNELYTTSVPKPVVVTNTGASAVSFGSATLSGIDAGDFDTPTDTCSNHTIQPNKKCKIAVTFSATQPVGTTETASLSINDNLGNSLATVPLSGTVVRGSVRASLSGLTVTITNPTTTQYGADWSVSGPYSVDSTHTTCLDVIFPQSVCQIVLTRTGPPAPGSIDIHMAPMGKGKSLTFDVPLD